MKITLLVISMISIGILIAGVASMVNNRSDFYDYTDMNFKDWQTTSCNPSNLAIAGAIGIAVGVMGLMLSEVYFGRTQHKEQVLETTKEAASIEYDVEKWKNLALVIGLSVISFGIGFFATSLICKIHAMPSIQELIHTPSTSSKSWFEMLRWYEDTYAALSERMTVASYVIASGIGLILMGKIYASFKKENKKTLLEIGLLVASVCATLFICSWIHKMAGLPDVKEIEKALFPICSLPHFQWVSNTQTALTNTMITTAVIAASCAIGFGLLNGGYAYLKKKWDEKYPPTKQVKVDPDNKLL